MLQSDVNVTRHTVDVVKIMHLFVEPGGEKAIAYCNVGELY